MLEAGYILSPVNVHTALCLVFKNQQKGGLMDISFMCVYPCIHPSIHPSSRNHLSLFLWENISTPEPPSTLPSVHVPPVGLSSQLENWSV